MGWIESLQRASRAPKWLPSAIRDAAKKVPKALDLRLPPSDDEKDGVWYTFTDDDRRVAQWDSSADVSVVALYRVTKSHSVCVMLYASLPKYLRHRLQRTERLKAW